MKVVRGDVTAEERSVMRWAFEAGFNAEQTAARVGRSRRTVARYFDFYAGKPLERGRKPPRKLPSQTKPLKNPSRFYVSEFVPT